MGYDNKIKSYRDLRVWQQSLALAQEIYRVTRQYPPDERYGLTSQMRRAAVSISSNIAEGHARLGPREYLRFISIALGSLAELETQMFISRELGFLPSEDTQLLLEQADAIGRMLRGIQKSLEPQCLRDPGTTLYVTEPHFTPEDDFLKSALMRAGETNSSPESRDPSPLDQTDL